MIEKTISNNIKTIQVVDGNGKPVETLGRILLCDADEGYTPIAVADRTTFMFKDINNNINKYKPVMRLLADGTYEECTMYSAAPDDRNSLLASSTPLYTPAILNISIDEPVEHLGGGFYKIEYNFDGRPIRRVRIFTQKTTTGEMIEEPEYANLMLLDYDELYYGYRKANSIILNYTNHSAYIDFDDGTPGYEIMLNKQKTINAPINSDEIKAEMFIKGVLNENNKYKSMSVRIKTTMDVIQRKILETNLNELTNANRAIVSFNEDSLLLGKWNQLDAAKESIIYKADGTTPITVTTYTNSNVVSIDDVTNINKNDIIYMTYSSSPDYMDIVKISNVDKYDMINIADLEAQFNMTPVPITADVFYRNNDGVYILLDGSTSPTRTHALTNYQLYTNKLYYKNVLNRLVTVDRNMSRNNTTVTSVKVTTNVKKTTLLNSFISMYSLGVITDYIPMVSTSTIASSYVENLKTMQTLTQTQLAELSSSSITADSGFISVEKLNTLMTLCLSWSVAPYDLSVEKNITREVHFVDCVNTMESELDTFLARYNAKDGKIQSSLLVWDDFNKDMQYLVNNQDTYRSDFGRIDTTELYSGSDPSGVRFSKVSNSQPGYFYVKNSIVLRDNSAMVNVNNTYNLDVVYVSTGYITDSIIIQAQYIEYHVGVGYVFKLISSTNDAVVYDIINPVSSLRPTYGISGIDWTIRYNQSVINDLPETQKLYFDVNYDDIYLLFIRYITPNSMTGWTVKKIKTKSSLKYINSAKLFEKYLSEDLGLKITASSSVYNKPVSPILDTNAFKTYDSTIRSAETQDAIIKKKNELSSVNQKITTLETKVSQLQTSSLVDLENDYQSNQSLQTPTYLPQIKNTYTDLVRIPDNVRTLIRKFSYGDDNTTDGTYTENNTKYSSLSSLYLQAAKLKRELKDLEIPSIYRKSTLSFTFAEPLNDEANKIVQYVLKYRPLLSSVYSDIDNNYGSKTVYSNRLAVVNIDSFTGSLIYEDSANIRKFEIDVDNNITYELQIASINNKNVQSDWSSAIQYKVTVDYLSSLSGELVSIDDLIASTVKSSLMEKDKALDTMKLDMKNMMFTINEQLVSMQNKVVSVENAVIQNNTDIDNKIQKLKTEDLENAVSKKVSESPIFQEFVRQKLTVVQPTT